MTTYRHATLQPLERKKYGLVYGCIFDADQRRIDDWPILISSHSTRPAPALLQSRATPTARGGDVIYGGAWWSAFGHILTEVAPALCAVLDYVGKEDKRPIIFHCFHDVDLENLAPYVHWFLDRIGVPIERIQIVKEPTKFDSLTIPTAPFEKKYEYSKGVARQLDAFLDIPESKGDRDIYLTRRGWAANAARTRGEAEMEVMFASQGFEIVEPSSLSFDEQLELINGARRVAGFNGSALHWSILSRSKPEVISMGWDLKLQRGICALRDQSYRSLQGPGLERLRGRSQRRITPNYVQQALFRP